MRALHTSESSFCRAAPGIGLTAQSLPCCCVCAGAQLLESESCWRAGEGAPRGVEGQVQQLLQDAQDPANLCRMYAGWAAWL